MSLIGYLSAGYPASSRVDATHTILVNAPHIERPDPYKLVIYRNPFPVNQSMKMAKNWGLPVLTQTVILVMLNTLHLASEASTPKPMIDNVAVMAEAKASLSHCAKSQDGATALRESSRLILEIKSTYPNCKGGFVGDMAAYLTEAEHSWERFKSKR